MCKMKDLNHPLHPLLPTRLDDTCPHTLRHKSDQQYFYRNVTACRMKRTEDFFTLSIFKKWYLYFNEYNITVVRSLKIFNITQVL